MDQTARVGCRKQDPVAEPKDSLRGTIDRTGTDRSWLSQDKIEVRPTTLKQVVGQRIGQQSSVTVSQQKERL